VFQGRIIQIKDRISKANIGRIAHNKGVHMTAEQFDLD